MTIGSAFRAVADALEEFEAAGFEIVDARSREGDEGVAVEFETDVPALDRIEDGVEVRIDDVSLTEDGRLAFDLSASVAAERDDRIAADNDSSEDRPLDGGRASGRTDGPGAASNGEHASRDEERAASGKADARDEGPGAEPSAETNGTPPHRDPEKLRAVYREYDTFADMTEALGVDVTSQTVRRQMIEHGIHVPSSSGGPDESEGENSADAIRSDVDSDDGAETDPTTGDGADAPRDDEREGRREATVADGIDLPDGTSLDELKRAVRSSRTVYEVARTLGSERERTRRLLDELDLLDLVTGRISEEREVTAEEVDRRVDRAAPGSV